MPKRKVIPKEDDDEDEKEEKPVKILPPPGPCFATPMKFTLTRGGPVKPKISHSALHSLQECLEQNDKYMVFVRYLQVQTPQTFSIQRSEMSELMTKFITVCRFHRGNMLVTVFQELTRLLALQSDYLMFAVIRLMSAMLTRVRDIPTVFGHCLETIWKPFMNMNTQRTPFPFEILTPEISLSPFVIRDVLPIYTINLVHIMAHLMIILRKDCPLSQKWIVYYLLQQHIQQLQEYEQMEGLWMTLIQMWPLESSLDVDFLSLMLVPVVGWLHQEQHRQKIKRIEEEEEQKKKKEEERVTLAPLPDIGYPTELKFPWSWFYEIASGVEQNVLKSKRWNAVILSGIKPNSVYCSDLTRIAQEEIQLFTITWESRAFTVWKDYAKWLLDRLPRELAYSILEMRSKYSSQEILGTMYKRKH